MREPFKKAPKSSKKRFLFYKKNFRKFQVRKSNNRNKTAEFSMIWRQGK
jgi:hypothetical protein